MPFFDAITTVTNRFRINNKEIKVDKFVKVKKNIFPFSFEINFFP